MGRGTWHSNSWLLGDGNHNHNYNQQLTFMGHFSARHCANPQLTLAIIHKEGTTMSILQVKKPGFRKIKEVIKDRQVYEMCVIP